MQVNDEINNKTGEPAVKTRLDVYLQSKLSTDISRARIQKIIEDGRVSVNGVAVTKKNFLVDDGDDVIVDDESSLTTSSQTDILPQAQDIPLDIIFEDEFIAVINKPAGLVVHPGNGNRDGTVVNALVHKFGAELSGGSLPCRPGIVHRLDKDTTGALLVAKTDAAHTAFANLFSERKIRKIYNGFCIGARPQDHEIIDLPLARSRRDPLKRAVDIRNGKEAVTEYNLQAHNSGISFVEFILHTGRTHQIRVHCAHKGFPIINDELYGGGKSQVQKIAPMERPFAYALFKCFNRQALHAKSLSFIHPFTKKEIMIEAPLPSDFCAGIEKIKST